MLCNSFFYRSKDMTRPSPVRLQRLRPTSQPLSPVRRSRISPTRRRRPAMDSAEPAEKVAALEADLTAKSLRIAELEARVSLLEAENARFKAIIARGEAPDLRGGEDPVFARLEDGSSVEKQKTVGKLGGDGYCGVIVLSDGEEEGIALDANKGISPEVGVPTPRKHDVRGVTGQVEGGRESGKEKARWCDSDLWLEDDDVSVSTPSSKKRAAAAARVVTSDSEDEEDANAGGKPGCANDDGGGQNQTQMEEALHSRKRALCGIAYSEDDEDSNDGVQMASEDEDDRIPISQLLKKMKKERMSHVTDDEFSDAKGCSTPPTRRSARLDKNQSKRRQAARRVLSFVEPKEHETSGDDTEEDDDMDDFIVDDEDSVEHAGGSADESCAETEASDASAPDGPEPEESDSEINYAEVMASIGRKRKTQDWKFEAEMLAAFDEHPELCLKAVCALYRRQTKEEQRDKFTFLKNYVGFNQIDAPRASCIAEFLLDGDLYGPLKKSVQDLERHDPYAFEFCRKVASRYSKQLFTIYQNKEDPYFHP